MSTFSAIESRPIAQLGTLVTLFEHERTGARHIHFANGDAERAFLIAFPTLPMSSDGRAHVLEHLLLCGSRRFPVRDPFFAMMGRSLATFMNAMTYPDRTVYPFATPDARDYFHLMDVYLDATFFPCLDRRDFLQEAWRPALDGETLGLKGVVLNEMKGYYADRDRVLYLGLNRALLPGSTFAFDAGGDPSQIPRLTHETVVAFHARHYHPSNAVFMSWGDIDVEEVQDRIEARALSAFSERQPPMVAEPVAAWSGLREVTIDVPAPAGVPRQHQFQMAWRLGPEADAEAKMKARLLESALLAPGSGVLRTILESTGIGLVSDYIGLDVDSTEILLHVGMAGLEKSQLDPARESIIQALRQASQIGVAPDLLRASLKEMRYDDRRVTSGVRRLINLAPAALRRQDALAELDLDARLVRLEKVIDDPDFIRRSVFKMMYDLPVLAAHVRPDPQFIAMREAETASFLQSWRSGLTMEEQLEIGEQAADLARHQLAVRAQTDEVLPRMTPGDVSVEPRPMLTLAKPLWQDHAASLHSNGLSQALLKLDLCAADEGDWPWFHLYAELIPHLGARGMDHQGAATWRRMRVSSLKAHCDAHALPDGRAMFEMTLNVEALREDQGEIATVLAAWFEAPDLDDAVRLRYLIADHVQKRLANLAEETAQLSALEAQAEVSAVGRLERAARGLPSLVFLGQLREWLEAPEGFTTIINGLQRTHAFLARCPRVIVCAGPEGDASRLLAQVKSKLADTPAQVHTTKFIPPLRDRSRPIAVAVFSPSQVNHCVAIWKVPSIGHRDAASLAVLAQLLEQQLLHPMLRERGGAYGANAIYRPERGLFMCMTVSDPRLEATYLDMQTSLGLLHTQDFAARAMEEAVISVIKRLDPPARGLADLTQAWSTTLAGFDLDQRRTFRQSVLDASLNGVRAAAKQHLHWVHAHRAAAVGSLEQNLAGLRVVDLQRQLSDLGLSS